MMALAISMAGCGTGRRRGGRSQPSQTRDERCREREEHDDNHDDHCIHTASRRLFAVRPPERYPVIIVNDPVLYILFTRRNRHAAIFLRRSWFD